MQKFNYNLTWNFKANLIKKLKKKKNLSFIEIYSYLLISGMYQT